MSKPWNSAPWRWVKTRLFFFFFFFPFNFFPCDDSMQREEGRKKKSLHLGMRGAYEPRALQEAFFFFRSTERFITRSDSVVNVCACSKNINAGLGGVLRDTTERRPLQSHRGTKRGGEQGLCSSQVSLARYASSPLVACVYHTIIIITPIFSFYHHTHTPCISFTHSNHTLQCLILRLPCLVLAPHQEAMGSLSQHCSLEWVLASSHGLSHIARETWLVLDGGILYQTNCFSHKDHVSKKKKEGYMQF